MALPARDKTFGLENCRSLLNKLLWEKKHLESSLGDVEALMFVAFNAAVTAWHLGDWVWADMTEEQRDALRIEWNLELKDRTEFLFALRQRERSLAICREIATASKHVKVSQSPDRGIGVTVKAEFADVITNEGEVAIEHGGSPVTSATWNLYVIDGEDSRCFQHVLELALCYWTEFIFGRGVAK
jgi:hypothetical protein